MTKEGFNFDFDERTEVPTFEEVSFVFPKIKAQKKPFLFSYILLIILAIAILGGGGFAIYKYHSNIQNGFIGQLTGNSIGKVSSLMTNNINPSDQNKFGITIEEIEINLTDEETTLKNSLITTCTNEKTQIETNTKANEESECTSEKVALNTKISELEKSVKSWETKYNSCKDDLEDCEGE